MRADRLDATIERATKEECHDCHAHHGPRSGIEELGPYAVALIGALLFVDLFLDWHRASVSVTGIVDVEAGSSAWAGWGAVAGVLLIALLLWEGSRLVGADVAHRFVQLGVLLATVAPALSATRIRPAVALRMTD